MALFWAWYILYGFDLMDIGIESSVLILFPYFI
jgi:hypothetical protein